MKKKIILKWPILFFWKLLMIKQHSDQVVGLCMIFALYPSENYGMLARIIKGDMGSKVLNCGM